MVPKGRPDQETKGQVPDQPRASSDNRRVLPVARAAEELLLLPRYIWEQSRDTLLSQNLEEPTLHVHSTSHLTSHDDSVDPFIILILSEVETEPERSDKSTVTARPWGLGQPLSAQIFWTRPLGASQRSPFLRRFGLH